MSDGGNRTSRPSRGEAKPSLTESLPQKCECGYAHEDYCGGELCRVCETCGEKSPCDECLADERERDEERAERLFQEDVMLYGI